MTEGPATGDDLRAIVDDVQCAVVEAVGLSGAKRCVIHDSLQHRVANLAAADQARLTGPRG